MTSPKLRFKEFDGDWLAATLENLAEVERGKFSVRPRNDPRYFGGEMPFVQTGDVTGSDVYLKGYSQTLNTDGIRVSKVFPADTILITIAANIGDTTITKYPVACPDSVVAIQPKREKANTIFLKNIIDLQKDNLDSQATQNAQKNINLQVLKPLELIVPSKEEQTKIASFLSAVDEKISQLTQKYELLSQYKQGMMQKLFSQQIRFKEDDGSEFGRWEEKILAEIGVFKNGLNKDKESFGFGFPFINLMDVFGNKVVETDKLGLVDANQKDLENYDLKKGDVLFIRSSVKAEGVGQTALVMHDLPNTVYSGFLIRFRESYGLDLGFKKYCFMNNDFRLQLLAKSTTSANTNINQESLSSLSIKIPCLEEQTKIANFLSAIDQKIETVAQQIEQAKQWKKGLLQQMFV